AGIQSATSRQNTKDQVYAQNEMLAYQQKESTARVASIMENTNLSKQQQVSEIMRQCLLKLKRLVSILPMTKSKMLLLAVLLLLLLVAPCLNCLEAVKKPPPVAFKVMCLLPITILRSEERRVGKECRSRWSADH